MCSALVETKEKGLPTSQVSELLEGFFFKFSSFALNIDRMKQHALLKIWHKPVRHSMLCSGHRILGVTKALANWDDLSQPKSTIGCDLLVFINKV